MATPGRSQVSKPKRLSLADRLFRQFWPEEPIPAAWSVRTGEYEIINDDGQLTGFQSLKLVQEDRRLFLELVDTTVGKEPQRLLLRPKSNSEAQVLQLLPDADPLIRVMPTPDGEVLVFSGYVAVRRAH